jgi:ATP-dependent DNA helicase PIF1
MYLNNAKFESGICNGSIGIVTAIDIVTTPSNPAIYVQFPSSNSVTTLPVIRDTVYFNHYGCPGSRCQFPILPAYALTIHRAQGLTLPHVSLYLDDSIFEPGQAYVALSRARRLTDIHIVSFDLGSL